MQTITSKDGTKIAYDKSGSGPAVILVDGAMCSRAMGPMPELAAVLSKDFTVYTYDRRGRNESGDTQPYSVEREIEDIEALVDLAGAPVYLYGMSSGAVLAARAAAALGPKVSKLALYEAPLVLDDSRPPVAEDYMNDYKRLLAEGKKGEMVEVFNTKVVGLPAEFLEPMKSSPMWPLMEAVAPTLIYDAQVMGDMQASKPLSKESRAMLGTIKADPLVIDGGASPSWMHTAADALGENIPGAKRKTIPGQDHTIGADALAPDLIQFFRN